MTSTRVTFMVQVNIDHDDYDDDDNWIESYEEKVDEMAQKLSEFGLVDVVSEDSDRFEGIDIDSLY
jgi:tRNA U34 5-carboxymethylaminomethyl modifying GTPase MnmE/TrmE